MILIGFLLFLKDGFAALDFKKVLCLSGKPVFKVSAIKGSGFDGVNFLDFGVFLGKVWRSGFVFVFEGLGFLESVLVLFLIGGHGIYF
jgi:hypothetical protein